MHRAADDDRETMYCMYFLFGGMFIIGIIFLVVLYPREIAYRNSLEPRTCRCTGFQEIMTSDGGYVDMQVELLDKFNNSRSLCQWNHLTTWVVCDAQDYSHCMTYARHQYFNQTFDCVVMQQRTEKISECDAALPRSDFSNPEKSTGFVVGMCFTCIGGFYSCILVGDYLLRRKKDQANNLPQLQEEGFETTVN